MEKKRIRIYVSPRAHFTDSAAYSFIAEFESGKLAGYYMRYMRSRGKYPDKDIILQEVFVKDTAEGELTVKGEIVCICAVSGEYLIPEEWLD